MGPALPCAAHFLPPSTLFMQPIVFLKAIVPFTSSIIDLSADTSSASSLSNGRHPPSSAPFHPSFFFSLGFQSPLCLSWVSVPLHLSWGFSPPSSLMGFQSPFVSVGFQSPFISVGFQSPFISMGFIPLRGFSPPLSLMGFIPLWGFTISVPLHLPWVSFPHGVSVPPLSRLFSVSVGRCPSVSVHPPSHSTLLLGA
jgi:hypothetical protein